MLDNTCIKNKRMVNKTFDIDFKLEQIIQETTTE